MILDLRGMSALADFFLFATAESTRQFRAISESIRRTCKSHKVKVGNIEGKESGRWLLVDLFDVIVHVFDPESRIYYDLELLWGDAPRLDWNGIETPEIPQTPAREERVYRTLSLPE